ncbi:DUF1145 domain-containing protein [Sansalvadorimonas sp. 2012CJ34-2]|uniref:DUF1145 domain-containing protein n=1 Tax=Parendozoicomonas callyspongiae TaxID=2942213 RepID=A0ABT0PLA3_9GAMM|nr:DUF1145 domain-containing protein [Sansalvadorimonas sp. 2012CJ34-2]MCL6272026.1 DUF1145 domain-containing protein [Sansalvadorimonas sp. 2012CJ34-2]
MYSPFEKEQDVTEKMAVVLNILRVITLLFWGTVLSTFFLSWSQPLGEIVSIVGGCILLAHSLEAILFRKRLLQIGTYTAKDAALILVFGVFHVAGRYLEATEGTSK